MPLIFNKLGVTFKFYMITGYPTSPQQFHCHLRKETRNTFRTFSSFIWLFDRKFEISVVDLDYISREKFIEKLTTFQNIIIKEYKCN